MGKATYLATPPSSTFLGPRPGESLPEISLGPARMNGAAASDIARIDQASASVAHHGAAPYTYNNPRSATGTETANKSAARKNKPSRKTTHSQIEKRRREKINDTMQRLKDLVPACHDQDLLLRKLDVLTATADYIEELQTMLYGRPMPPSPASLQKSPSDHAAHFEDSQVSTRRSSRTRETTTYLESGSNSSAEEQDSIASPQLKQEPAKLEVDDVSAAESLLHISESPMLRPVVERNRLSISELMCL